MNFPPPPSFNDPQLFPPPPPPSATPRQNQEQAQSRSYHGIPPGVLQFHHQQQQQFSNHQHPQAPQQPQLQPHHQPPPPPQQQQLQPQQYQQQILLMNGVNGGNMAGAVASVPTPAGHQAELNYIYGMVEELSRQLAENKRALEDVVSGVGRVRNRARNRSLSNEELIAAAGDEVEAQDRNLDSLVSLLSEALDKAKYSRDANAALLSHYASVVSTMLKQFHEYKAKHVADVAAWHRSYRAQLAEARAENSRLREQIWDMQSHAGHANELLRAVRSKYDDDSARWESRVDARAVRQELRFWKRMAMPELADDDPYWSGDDDLIDPAEKQRLGDLEIKAAQEQLARAAGAMSDPDSGGEECEAGSQQHQQAFSLASLMGTVPMQRDDSAVPPGI